MYTDTLVVLHAQARPNNTSIREEHNDMHNTMGAIYSHGNYRVM